MEWNVLRQILLTNQDPYALLKGRKNVLETDRWCSLIESVCTEMTHKSSDQALPRSVLLCWKDPQMVPTHHTFIPRRRHTTAVTRLCLDLYCCVGRIHKWCQRTIHLFSWQIKSAIVLFFVALLIAVEGVCDNHFITAISVGPKEVGSVLYVLNLQIAHCLHWIIFGSKRSKSGSLDRSGWISHGVCLYSFWILVMENEWKRSAFPVLHSGCMSVL
jgi:hypothetical protein